MSDYRSVLSLTASHFSHSKLHSRRQVCKYSQVTSLTGPVSIFRFTVRNVSIKQFGRHPSSGCRKISHFPILQGSLLGQLLSAPAPNDLVIDTNTIQGIQLREVNFFLLALENNWYIHNNREIYQTCCSRWLIRYGDWDTTWISEISLFYNQLQPKIFSQSPEKTCGHIWHTGKFVLQG